MNSKFYKYCAVPMCESTTIKTPNKLFVYLPKSKTIRKQWFKLARRDTPLKSKNVYFCEDHFDLPNDMENYMQFKILGSVSRIRMKADCLPSKFLCQPDKKHVFADISRPTSVKSSRTYLVKEYFAKNQVVAVTQECIDSSENNEILIRSTDPVKCPLAYLKMKEEVEIVSQDYNQASREEFIELNKNYNQNINKADGENDSVLVKLSPIYPKIEEVDYTIKNEKKVEIETYSYEQEEYTEIPEEKMVESVDSHTRQIMKSEDGTESVPIDYVQVDPKTEDEIEIEEIVKQEMDSYQEESEEALGEQFVEAKENIDDTVDERIKEIEKNFKSITADPRKKTFKFKTCQQERKFECHLCEYKCKRKSYLNVHLNSVHLNERKFQCHLCEYKTNRKSDLGKHVSYVHLNERNFECQFCDYKANQKSNLNKHVICKHFTEYKFACHLCDYVGNLKYYLNRHMRSFHLKER